MTFRNTRAVWYRGENFKDDEGDQTDLTERGAYASHTAAADKCLNVFDPFCFLKRCCPFAFDFSVLHSYFPNSLKNLLLFAQEKFSITASFTVTVIGF